jgi:hypothetical protein
MHEVLSRFLSCTRHSSCTRHCQDTCHAQGTVKVLVMQKALYEKQLEDQITCLAPNTVSAAAHYAHLAFTSTVTAAANEAQKRRLSSPFIKNKHSRPSSSTHPLHDLMDRDHVDKGSRERRTGMSTNNLLVNRSAWLHLASKSVLIKPCSHLFVHLCRHSRIQLTCSILLRPLQLEVNVEYVMNRTPS